MTNREPLKLRDFIYLDVERLKSLLAQLDRGLLSERADSAGTTKGGEAKGGFSVPILAELGGTVQYVATDQSAETRTLHDFVFNEVEEKLGELGRIKNLPEDFSRARLLSEEVRSGLSPVEYVRATGKVALSDYAHVISLLQNANDLYAASTELAFQDRIKAATGNQVNAVRQEMRNQISSMKLDDKLVKSLRTIFDVFLKDRLVIRAFPFLEDRSIRVVGPLQPQLLRESLDDIRFKFGSSPAMEWVVFGQIAAVPQQNEVSETLDLEYSNELEKGFQSLVGSMRSIEDLIRVKYPEIVITPIAVYRE